MLVSLNEIKKLVKIPESVSVEELIQLIGSRLVEVEGSVDWSERYKGAYIAKVVSAEPIPDTHLHLCKIDAGAAGADFAADYAAKHPEEALTNDEDLVQVVCGAPNVHAGMLAVWLQPGAIVPSTFDDEKFKLSVRALRGYESYGMLAGADELGLDTEHKFIAEIDPKTAVAGDSFAEVFDLNDVILDIENKSLTHRPDTFGLIGFAREVAGILGVPFEEPAHEFSLEKGFKKTAEGLQPIEIEIADTALCPRYSAAVFEVNAANLDNATEATKYLTADAVFLAKAGMRAISKIVDATNIVMLYTGQPLHAFDYDKFVAVGGGKTAKILVRAARAGEKLQLLDGKEIELTESDIVITSNDVPVALAGAMGGMSTEIDASTKRVILESATFSLYNERKMQMAHGIFSEAITRFTKGQPAAGTIPALERCAGMLLDSPAEVADFEDEYPNPVKQETISLLVQDVNSLLGTKYTEAEMVKTLENVGFKVEAGENLKVTAPDWRTDIHIKEDVIEEIGRLRGYDNIPATLPLRPFVGAERNALFDLKRELRSILSDRINAHEVLTYSFVSKSLQEKCGEDTADSYEIVNSISPELECFRQSILPSLLEKLAANQRAGFSNFALYEMNQVTRKSLGVDEDKVPNMENRLSYICTGDYFVAKAALTEMFKALRIEVHCRAFEKIEESGLKLPMFEPLHSAEFYVKDAEGNERLVAVLGEVRRSMATKLKAEGEVAGFELDLEVLLAAERHSRVQLNFSKFPATSRDITLKVNAKVTFAELEGKIVGSLEGTPDLVFTVDPVSIYAPENGAGERNISFHITFASTEKTLTSDEISAIMKNIEQSTESLGAETI